MTAILLIALGALAVLWAVARYRHRDVLRDWSGILSPEAARTLEAVEEHAELDRHMGDDAWSRAWAAQESAEWQEAVRLLELAYWVIEEATPSRLQRLRAMTRVCRQAAAILPIPKLEGALYKLRKVKAAVLLGGVLHALLVTPMQRMVLRCRLLLASFRLAVWTIRRSRSRIGARPERGAAWRAFADAWSDWKTLDLQHVQTYRAVLIALSAEVGEKA